MIQQMIEWGFPRHEAADALDRVKYASCEVASNLIHVEAEAEDDDCSFEQDNPISPGLAGQQGIGLLPRTLSLRHMRAETQQLENMGFRRDDARVALSHCNGDVGSAVGWLTDRDAR